jgi:very-short-patch-repair endonuclease
MGLVAHQSRTAERKIARLATRAHGVVTHRELRRAGVTVDEIRGRIDSGALIRVFPGVYRAGHSAPSVEARYMAAVKACGKGALLSGLSAAWLWGLINGAAPPPEVTARTERRIKGIKTRRCRRMDRRDATRHRGIPITTVPATLVRVPSLLSFDDLARATHQAVIRHHTTPEQIQAAQARHPNAAGAKLLRAIVKGDAPVLLSKLDRRFRAQLHAAGLPLPKTNTKAGSHYVDCRWPAHKLTVELDSYRYHHSRHAWEQDRRRDREAHHRGDQLRRYTWTDVIEEPEPMLAELRELLTPPESRGASCSP